MLAYETDVTKTVDPFAGSYVVESLTDDLEAEVDRLMAEVAERGGAVEAIELGFQKQEIERSAYEIAREVDSGERVVVGVNRYAMDTEDPYEPLRVDPAIEAAQCDRLARLRAERDGAEVEAALRGDRRRGAGHRQRAAAPQTRPRRPRHRRRGLRRPPGRLGDLPADGQLLSELQMHHLLGSAPRARGADPELVRCWVGYDGLSG